LVDASRGASLTVVGSLGHGRVREVLLGSVALHVAAHSRCPGRGDPVRPRPPRRPDPGWRGRVGARRGSRWLRLRGSCRPRYRGGGGAGP
jgi:hypothetical protein